MIVFTIILLYLSAGFHAVNSAKRDGHLKIKGLFLEVLSKYNLFEVLSYSCWQLAFAIHFNYISIILDKYFYLFSIDNPALIPILKWITSLRIYHENWWVGLLINFLLIKYLFTTPYKFVYKYFQKKK